MPLRLDLRKQSTLTGLSVCLFIAGLVLFFFALYHETRRGGPIMWLAVVLLLGTIACWIASARAGDREG